MSDEPIEQQIMDGAEPTFSSGASAHVAGVLLLHDLGDTPQEMKSLSETLSEAGFAVDVPLLPGHGTEIDDLEATTWDDWSAAAQLALDELSSRTTGVVVCGIGMGATLACFVSADHPFVQGVVAINPRTLPVPPQAIDTLQAMLDDGCHVVPPLGPDISDRTAKVLSYGTVPVKTLMSMFEALGDMSEHWGEYKVPTLLVTSSRDHRVSPENGDWLEKNSGGPVERLVLEDSFHLALLDVERDKLEAAIKDFVETSTASDD